MSIALDLALQLTLGAAVTAPAAPPPPGGAVRATHRLVWGTTEVSARNTTGWGFGSGRNWNHRTGWAIARARAWAHTISWSLPLARQQTWAWGLRLESSIRLPYADLRRHQMRLGASYGERPMLRAQGVLPFGDLTLRRRQFQSPWSRQHRGAVAHRLRYALTESAVGGFRLGYAVTDVNPLLRRLSLPWAMLADSAIQAVANTPELLWNKQSVRLLQATLSCDEDSPVWMARIEVADRSDFARINLGDALTLMLNLETFALRVDGKTLSRDSEVTQRYEITAVSPVAVMESPFAAAITVQATTIRSARATVDGLLGSLGRVQWALPDWPIPAGGVLLDNVTPLAAARHIVAMIGGVLESAPDGTIICRRRHPVTLPQYGTAPVAHSLFDADVLGSVARIAPSRGFNRVTLANEESDATDAADRIEYVADADDPRQGTVRAWLGWARAVVLAHTGHPDTRVQSEGRVVVEETEVLEFIEGSSRTRYPVSALLSQAWQHTSLGDVAADGDVLVAAIRGYSLLKLTYHTSALHWRVRLAADEAVQFVLIDV